MVRGHQRHLLRWQVKHPRHAQVGVGVGFVGLEHLGAQHTVPGQPGALGHVGQQADVAVRQRGDGVALLEPRQALHAVGPGMEPVPHAVEVLALGLAQVAQPKARQDLVQDLPVQGIDQRPALFAAHHPRHGGLVARAPGQREGSGIHLGVERTHLARNAAVPVHHGAKDVERQHLHLGKGVVGVGGAGRGDFWLIHAAIVRGGSTSRCRMRGMRRHGASKGIPVRRYAFGRWFQVR